MLRQSDTSSAVLPDPTGPPMPILTGLRMTKASPIAPFLPYHDINPREQELTIWIPREQGLTIWIPREQGLTT